MTAVPKPTRAPKTKCARCLRLFTARAMLRHRNCGAPNKYGAKRTVTKGGAFPSKLESLTFDHLQSLKAAGYYAAVVRYDTVELIPGVKWKVDFVCSFPNGDLEWVEAKGVAGERYRVILQLWRELGPGKLVVYKADRSGQPVVAEVIVPRREALKARIAAVKEYTGIDLDEIDVLVDEFEKGDVGDKIEEALASLRAVLDAEEK